MLAYVYLTMGDYKNAAKLSQEVIDSKQYTLMNKTEIINSGFASVSIPGWMWAIDLTTSNSPALPTFWDTWTCSLIVMPTQVERS